MIGRQVISIACGLALAACDVSAKQICGAREIALTFDDAPTPDTAIFTGAARTARIIAALKDGDVEEAAFFVVSERAGDAENRKRLLAYAAAGHILANHTHSHPNLHHVGAEAFRLDVQKAHAALSPLPNFRALFRFPMLNEGETKEQRDDIRRHLEKLGYEQGYVTVDNYDFYIDRLLRDAKIRARPVDHDKAGALYVNMIVGAANHYDRIACTWLKRSPRHVLLLHENDAAALYLGRLIDALNAAGWRIIPVSAAYEDPIASQPPDTLLLGQGRVAALAHLVGAPAAELRHVGEDTDYLQEAFENVLKDSP